MELVEEGVHNPAGEALVEELRWVHGIIRTNLAELTGLAEQSLGGAPVAEVQQQLQDMSDTNIVWTLRRGCLRYCYLVHRHHGGEDAHFFPGLRRIDPRLHPVIDKLEADHLAISAYLDRVEAAARRIAGDEASRSELATALFTLRDHLITHLYFEEANLNPTLRRLTSWPLG